MTKDESTAMDWLGIHAAKGNTHAQTLQAMLAELAERRGAFGAWPGQVTVDEHVDADGKRDERPKRKGR